MQDNPNTDNQTQQDLSDVEDWEIAFEPYEGKPYAALQLGFNFAVLRTHLEGQLFKCPHVIEALDLGRYCSRIPIFTAPLSICLSGSLRAD